MLESCQCSFCVGNKDLVHEVSVVVEAGFVTAFMGPNGAGKSTLLKMMSGQISPSTGHVLLKDKFLSHYTVPQLALHRAVLAQSRAVGFPFRVFDVALMGRHPHSTGSSETLEDCRIVEECLKRTDSHHLSDRIYNTLSGGESARVDLARVLAQDADIFLLDEPTNHLDPKHQVAVLRLCRELAEDGKAVAVCMHDLNLAAQYCDQILLLKNGRAVAFGSPEETLTPDLLYQVYDLPFSVWERPDGGICIMPDAEGSRKPQVLCDQCS